MLTSYPASTSTLRQSPVHSATKELPMAWLRAVVDLTFLVLALVLITTLLANRYDGAGYNAVHVEIQNVKKDVLDVSMKNVLYLENRVNRVTESSDSYQVSVNNRLGVLENRMQGLEA